MTPYARFPGHIYIPLFGALEFRQIRCSFSLNYIGNGSRNCNWCYRYFYFFHIRFLLIVAGITGSATVHNLSKDSSYGKVYSVSRHDPGYQVSKV